MVIQNSVTEGEVRDALNVLPPDPSTYARFLEKMHPGEFSKHDSDFIWDWAKRASKTVKTPHDGFVLNYLATAPSFVPPSSPGAGWQRPPAVSRNESRLFREALTSAHLRGYVDQWLQTGRHPDGRESPGHRTIHNAPFVLDALLGYLNETPMGWQLSSDPSGFALDFGDTRHSSGKVRSFFEAAANGAKKFLAVIMASDWKDRLCKCRYHRCGHYFLHKKPRRFYAHGTFCSRRHASSFSAESSVHKSRTDGPKILIEEAARTLCASKVVGSNWREDVGLKRRLAKKLCSVISQQNLHGYREEVKVNWVTRHQEEIERTRSLLMEEAPHSPGARGDAR